ncbi:MAG: HD-GYP domain-containing protein [SAR324 cluster bacterium]|nr:HD-GYP domain-containing protein [SAR324 cluster bacterium]
MNRQSIFTSEEQIIKTAETFLTDDRYLDNPLFSQFSDLLKSYKKIFKQLKRLVKISDKQQARLNELNDSLETENYQLMLELGQSFESFVRALSIAVDAKHPLTAGHSNRVTEYSIFLGKRIGLSEDELELLKYAALLHDIGKIGVPDNVLTKKGRFNEEERLVMNQHAVWTYRILNDINLPKAFEEVPRIASCHHEKLDGTGYPHGLKGKKIHFFSRILAVSDVFDALTSLRDYPKYDGDQIFSFDPMSMNRAFSILQKESGNHFDPEVVSTIINERTSLEALWQHLYSDHYDRPAVDGDGTTAGIGGMTP